MKTTMDIEISDEGSLALFHLQTDTARSWVEEHVAADARYWGSALVVEPRFAADLAEGMSQDGLTIALRH